MKQYKLNLSNISSYTHDMDKLLEEFLKKRQLYSKDYIFTVIDGERLEEFKRNGTYRQGDKIFSFDISEMKFSEDVSFSLEKALDEYEHPAIAVYRADHFDPEAKYTYLYKFKNPENKVEAIEAIILVNY